MVGILSKFNVGNIILASGWFGRSIIIVLLIVSIISLAILIRKLKDFKRAEIQNESFLRYFRERASLAEFYEVRSKVAGPMRRILEEAYSVFRKAESDPGTEFAGTAPAVSSAISRAKMIEVHGFESHLVFIATVVTISPFLGLLGTVWGIMTAFMDIRTFGSAHINIVAPGIAEALITTVVGLCVAIPAVIFYNHLTNRASKLTDELDVFSNELMEEFGAGSPAEESLPPDPEPADPPADQDPPDRMADRQVDAEEENRV
jgi:biopolymer transport protein TolQ